jgi:glycosyltransferase involved in cell wall biosynthesis
LARALEEQLFPAAAFLTTSSEEIADAYAAAYHRRPIVIHNTFPLPSKPPDLDDCRGRLKMYWFSQTVGPDRGLEDVIQAAGMSSLDAELHLRGRAIPGYLAKLQRLAVSCAPKLALVAHDPAAPSEMVPCCRGYQIGLALEKPDVLNHNLCLSNKALTYILAGLAVVLTDTLGQRRLARQLGPGALLVGAGDVPGLAVALRRWDEDRGLLLRARQAAWNAARERWHWEHECERGRLLKTVDCAVTKNSCE